MVRSVEFKVRGCKFESCLVQKNLTESLVKTSRSVNKNPNGKNKPVKSNHLVKMTNWLNIANGLKGELDVYSKQRNQPAGWLKTNRLVDFFG